MMISSKFPGRYRLPKYQHPPLQQQSVDASRKTFSTAVIYPLWRNSRRGSYRVSASTCVHNEITPDMSQEHETGYSTKYSPSYSFWMSKRSTTFFRPLNRLEKVNKLHVVNTTGDVSICVLQSTHVLMNLWRKTKGPRESSSDGRRASSTPP